MQNRETGAVEIAARLSQEKEFWAYWGFEPWESGAFAGVFRAQRFVKSGILGRVAEYHAADYIIWKCGEEGSREELWRNLSPMEDVMTQRFLFVHPKLYTKRRIRSFWLGIKGFAEFYSFWPGEAHKVPRDLSGLVLLALEVDEKRTGLERPGG